MRAGFHAVEQPNILDCDRRLVGESGDQLDLFICECYLFDEQLPVHVSYRELEAHRDEIKARRVILWHFGPNMLENLSKVDMETAYDGMIVDIPRKDSDN